MSRRQYKSKLTSRGAANVPKKKKRIPNQDSELNKRPENAPQDYILNLEEERWEDDLVLGMLQRQHDQIEKIDTKLASLLAATAAAMYFFLEKATMIGDIFAAAIFIIPLVMALAAYQSYSWKDSGPKPLWSIFQRPRVRPGSWL